MKLTETNMQALRDFAATAQLRGHISFPDGPDREPLRKAGLIDRWNPVLKVTGRRKPWRITEAGRLVLSSDDQPQTDEMQPDKYTGGDFNGVVRGEEAMSVCRVIIPIRPMVAWYVGGRKIFGREPVTIRRSWKVGKYGHPALCYGRWPKAAEARP